MKEKYLPTIGLEIHAELKTTSKMFCRCKNDTDEEKANINICPICTGHPGTLPVLNHDAILKVLTVGLAVGGELANFTEWDRKNYFYPDIPKGYQISQYKYPLVSGGRILSIEIERIHLEEDTAQSTHDTHDKSLVNFNRAGVPLMELVTKPVIHDAKTASDFAKELQLLLRYLEAGEANMEKGEMRVEANISVSRDHMKMGTKTEVKNLNSFRAVQKAIEFEINRQIDILEKGESVKQETRGWDDTKEITFLQRSKESANDYRYFPDPDVPKMMLGEMEEFDHDAIRGMLPELPWAKRERYEKDFAMTDKESDIFVENILFARYFEDVMNLFSGDKKKIKLTVNYLLTDYLPLTIKKSVGVDSVSAKYFAELIDMISDERLSSRGAKDLIPYLVNESGSPESLAVKYDLMQKSDIHALQSIVNRLIIENEGPVVEYRAGKIASLQYLIGQGMKLSKGSANPTVLRELLVSTLSKK